MNKKKFNQNVIAIILLLSSFALFAGWNPSWEKPPFYHLPLKDTCRHIKTPYSGTVFEKIGNTGAYWSEDGQNIRQLVGHCDIFCDNRGGLHAAYCSQDDAYCKCNR